MSFAYPAPPAVSGLNIAQRITQRRDQELDDRIERAKTAYLEGLPEDGGWVNWVELYDRVDSVRPRIGDLAIKFAEEALEAERRIEQVAHQKVRRTPTSPDAAK